MCSFLFCFCVFLLCPIVTIVVMYFVFYCCFYFSKVEVKTKKAFNHFQNSNKDKLILFEFLAVKSLFGKMYMRIIVLNNYFSSNILLKSSRVISLVSNFTASFMMTSIFSSATLSVTFLNVSSFFIMSLA